MDRSKKGGSLAWLVKPLLPSRDGVIRACYTVVAAGIMLALFSSGCKPERNGGEADMVEEAPGTKKNSAHPGMASDMHEQRTLANIQRLSANDPKHIHLLSVYFDRGGDTVRSAVLRKMAESNSEEAVSFLKKVLELNYNDVDDLIKCNAAAALVRNRSESVESVVKSTYAGSPERVRSAFVSALLACNPPYAKSFLRTISESDPSSKIQLQALSALDKINRKKSNEEKSKKQD